MRALPISPRLFHLHTIPDLAYVEGFANRTGIFMYVLNFFMTSERALWIYLGLTQNYHCTFIIIASQRLGHTPLHNNP